MTPRRPQSVVLFLLRFVVDVPRRIVVRLLKLYRLVISPMYGPTCRFYPSCSEYALIAVGRWGVVRGGALAVWRLLRCNPWNRGGVDLVPRRGSGSDHPHPHDHVHAAAPGSASSDSASSDSASNDSVETPPASVLTSAPSSRRAA